MLAAGGSVTRAVDVMRVHESTWDDAVPQGKEVDAIYGDWVLRNEHVVAVIGEPIEGRNANMTVRNVGGSVIDLTVPDAQSDQLSAYYPVGTGYKLSGPVSDGKEITALARRRSWCFADRQLTNARLPKWFTSWPTARAG